MVSEKETAITEPLAELPPVWKHALVEHRRIIAEVRDAAIRVPEERWRQPLAPGRWSPAQEIEHLTVASVLMTEQLATGRSIAPMRTAWQQTLLRTLGFPIAVRMAWFPPVPSPVEAEPPARSGEVAEVTVRFQEAAEEFVTNLLTAHSASPDRKLTHPYFGELTLLEILRFITSHTRHHGRRLQTLEKRLHRPA